ncbi:MAG: hypothetical protein NVS4B10_04100 [Myxococcales bacterium]
MLVADGGGRHLSVTVGATALVPAKLAPAMVRVAVPVPGVWSWVGETDATAGGALTTVKPPVRTPTRLFWASTTTTS